MRNIFLLNEELASCSYKHGSYEYFRINDPKPRDIHKATVRDRLVHHLVHQALYPFFDRRFIADSFSCRLNKGTHKALERFVSFANKVSRNNTRTVWVLKCDIKKFFASVDHTILQGILRRYITDAALLRLLDKIISSFHSVQAGKGLPLGNLTSQLLVNIYMNEFDQFVKHQLRAKYYIRYADDFVIMSNDRSWLAGLIPSIESFLANNLKLSLHPDKISIRTLASGVDYLGWIIFCRDRVLRTKTKKRMLKRLKHSRDEKTIQSYLGLISHGNSYKLRQKITNP